MSITQILRSKPTELVLLNTQDISSELKSRFESILFRIVVSEPVEISELMPYLTLENKVLRYEINLKLADAFFKAEKYKQAKVFIQRAWLLSNFSPEVMPLYESIFSKLPDARAIQQAYKRLGLKAAAQGNIQEALKYFNSWQYSYSLQTRLEKYEYDFDILTSVEMLAQPYRLSNDNKLASPRTRKIRLGYLLKGITELNSVLMSISHTIARFHDKSRFEIKFFAPESYDAVSSSPQGNDWLLKFKEIGYEIVTAPILNDATRTLLGVGKRIHEECLDVLVTSAVLADLSHYFIACLRPSPIVIGLVQGPLPLFAPPTLDWCIAWSKHPLMDTPVNCSLVELKMAWPQRDQIKPYPRSRLDIPDNACILVSGGRPPKFQDEKHWQAIVDLLRQHENAYYVVGGTSYDQIPCLSTILPKSIENRVRLLGWRKDFLEILASSNIVLDTYPTGSGQVLVQAMSFGLPVVGHRNDYMKLYDASEWTPIEDFIQDPEIVVERGNFSAFKHIVSRLIEDTDYRQSTAERCGKQAAQADPANGVKQCEEIYIRVLECYLNRAQWQFNWPNFL